MLKTNTVLKTLDVSDNMQKNLRGRVVGGNGPGFAKELVAGLSANGALTNLTLAYNGLQAKDKKVIRDIRSSISIKLKL